ncbi:ABC transporter permease [Saccharothrix deserti]|uniref:ABC transporter permease n=1 Tax=Saccharothrix deserti TaxID=2593674 RepID=UPI00131D71E4|nr:ABC-2 family transporter protein [Saccharothrix deserti]
MTRATVPARRGGMAHRRRRARLYARIFALTVRARLQYRADFLLAILSGVAWQMSVLVVVGVLLTRFPQLDGWSGGEVVLLAGMRLAAHGIYVCLLSNIMLLPRIVEEGRLEVYRLRPVPMLTQVLLTSCNVNGVGDFFVGVTFLLVAVGEAGVEWTAGKVLFLLAALVGGALLEAAVQLVVNRRALRHPETLALSVWLDELFGMFGNYPLSILPIAVRALFTCVLPIAFIAYFPAAVITGKVDTLDVPAAFAYGSPLAGVLVFLTARALWYRSLRRYEGVTA